MLVSFLTYGTSFHEGSPAALVSLRSVLFCLVGLRQRGNLWGIWRIVTNNFIWPIFIEDCKDYEISVLILFLVAASALWCGILELGTNLVNRVFTILGYVYNDGTYCHNGDGFLLGWPLEWVPIVLNFAYLDTCLIELNVNLTWFGIWLR